MRVKNIKKLSLCTFALMLLGCNSVKIHNIEICSVAGKMSAGMDCAETLTAKTREMNLDETIVFLEPNEKEGRGGAYCESAKDLDSMKTSLEQACKLLGSQCSYEIQQTI